MKWKLLLVAVTFALPACSGRATLSEDSGRAARRIWEAQAQSQPRRPAAALAASDAKIIVDNHEGRFRVGAAAATTGGGNSGGSSGTGLVTPATGDLFGASGSDGGGGRGNSRIQLRAE